MGMIRRILNSFVFWGAWIIIPVLLEILPALGSLFLLIRRRRKMGKKAEQSIVYPEITLIVPVYNSADTLFACIRSISESTYPNERIRIFLVNNQGKDDSFSVYERCQEQYPGLRMQWLNAKQGKSRALNLALYNSEGKYIINLDSDGILEKNALANMITKFELNPTINCMTGAIMTTPEDIKKYKRFFPRLLRNLEFMEYAQAFLAGRSYASELNSVYTLSGAFSAFRKSAILKSRLYNTDTICEDTQITMQMRYLYNERVEICEDAIFMVDPIEGVNKLYTQRQRWQRGSLEVARMFLDKVNIRQAFTDVNVKTLLYDHTFAFPRLIWYLALICLLCMNYSGMILVQSVGMIMVLYVLVGYLYFLTVLVFLRKIPELYKYYRNHWWCVLLLPAFNFIVFFIRMAGIINSIQTDSAWKTRNLTDERNAFEEVVRQDTDGIGSLRRKLQAIVNREKTCAEQGDMQNRVGALWFVVVGIVFFLGVVLLFACQWVGKTYGVGVNEILNTLRGPLTGTGTDVVVAIVRGIVLPAVVLLLVFSVLAVVASKCLKRRCEKHISKIHVLFACSAMSVLFLSVIVLNHRYDLLDYYQVQAAKTQIYEDYYVDPKGVEIAAKEKKNLIFLYLESMETTYADKASGGEQAVNYMPNLTQLADNNVSFSDGTGLGGYHTVTGTGYTMGALFGTSTGVPYALTVDSTQMEDATEFATGITTLGDILNDQGYVQEFLCGSDAAFGGRKLFFTTHGDYQIFDLFTARKEGYIAKDYYEWWGYEDKILFEIAKDELLRLEALGEPFNLTFLTCDTHHIGGYVCDLCEDTYGTVTANVVHCTDRLVEDFLSWCSEQDFYEDTVIVIVGDHPRMDTYLVDGVSYYERTMYNCFINSAVAPANTENRICTPLDMFPTVLAAMGYQIEGDRLGLGTNLFSDKKTLAEEHGFDWLERELSKSSDYYIETFAPEMK